MKPYANYSTVADEMFIPLPMKIFIIFHLKGRYSYCIFWIEWVLFFSKKHFCTFLKDVLPKKNLFLLMENHSINYIHFITSKNFNIKIHYYSLVQIMRRSSPAPSSMGTPTNHLNAAYQHIQHGPSSIGSPTPRYVFT